MMAPCIARGDEVYIMVIAEPENAAENKVTTAWHAIDSQKLPVYKVARA